ncbi:uncharacterized protein LOC113793116 [Dermatophagoides pteronyssinus]|uniref:Uncharacterized protein n=1 Tax=Dermatophagoides pteronyssinus TaxID=6956 RepID=A0ABQ8JAW9_DERPT|nr:hypothetical protein DERP_009637 [Dermatophagoides pteronyssinus]
MKIIIAFASLLVVASAIPAPALLAPAAYTYQTQKSALVPIGTHVSTSVSHGAPVIAAAPIPVAHGYNYAAPVAAASLGYGYGKILGAAPLAIGHGYAPLGYGAPLAYGYGH